MTNTSFPSAQYPLRNPSQTDALGFTLTCLYGQFSFEHKPAKKKMSESYFQIMYLMKTTFYDAPCKKYEQSGILSGITCTKNQLNYIFILQISKCSDHIQFVGPHIYTKPYESICSLEMNINHSGT